MRSFFLFLSEAIKVVIISLAIIIPIRTFVIQPFYVKGASMEPNFYDHEYLIVDEISYRFKAPKRGDIVVFRYPKNPQEYFIKRIIALPEEKIKIEDGEVYIFNNEFKEGFTLDESYLSESLKTYSISSELVELSHDEYYVLGDNRNSSKDSRSFGPIDKSFIIGKVLFRGWPFDRINLFSEEEYQY